MNPPLLLLSVCQGLFLTNNIVFIAINGLVGLSLAPLGWMATLPVMGYVVGGALSTGLVARTQSRYGRQISFQIGLAVALLSALLCAYACFSRNFWLLVVATVVAGYYSANGQLYRFAAAELALPAFREKAVSLVLAGGLICAVIGPIWPPAPKTCYPFPLPAPTLLWRWWPWWRWVSWPSCVFPLCRPRKKALVADVRCCKSCASPCFWWQRLLPR